MGMYEYKRWVWISIGDGYGWVSENGMDELRDGYECV